MALEELILPGMGESIMEATILKWLKQTGDQVTEGETIVEIATDKVDSEVPATTSGVLKEILVNENDVVAIGAVIAKIETVDEQPENDRPETSPVLGNETSETSPQHTAEKQSQSLSTSAHDGQESASPQNFSAKFYSPLVLNIAQNENIPLSELEKLSGTGKDGRVTKNDILTYVANRTPQNNIIAEPPPTAIIDKAATKSGASHSRQNNEIIEMDRMRRLIADHMVKSLQTSPHVTSFAEADVTNMVNWREAHKSDFEKREGTKITFTPLFIEAIVKCIKKYPLINSSVDGDKIIIKKNIHIGLAAALPSGNLIVPVIKNADQLNLGGLAKQVNHLADAARKGKLKPEDTQDGTFTVTNVGSFGSITGTPIINQPQVAILAVGAIKKKPVVLETEFGDTIAIRHMMVLSMSYDHRIIDGALGSTFLAAVAKEFENFRG